jgi:hypothetical protein
MPQIAAINTTRHARTRHPRTSCATLATAGRVAPTSLRNRNLAAPATEAQSAATHVPLGRIPVPRTRANDIALTPVLPRGAPSRPVVTKSLPVFQAEVEKWNITLCGASQHSRDERPLGARQPNSTHGGRTGPTTTPPPTHRSSSPRPTTTPADLSEPSTQPTPQQLTVALQVNELPVTTRANRIRTQEQPQPIWRARASTTSGLDQPHLPGRACRHPHGRQSTNPRTCSLTDRWLASPREPLGGPARRSGLDQITAPDARPTGALDRRSAMALHEHGAADVALPERTRTNGERSPMLLC